MTTSIAQDAGSGPAGPDSGDGRPRRGESARVAGGWAVILLICGLAMGLVGDPGEETFAEAELVLGAPIGLPEEMSGRMSLAIARMLPEDQRSGIVEMSGLLGGSFSPTAEVGPRRRLAAVVLAAEAESPSAALARLPAELEGEDLASLEAVRVWIADALGAMDRGADVPVPTASVEATLRTELGWFGEVASDWIMPSAAPSRVARQAAADRTLLTLAIFSGWFALMGTLGLVVALVLVVMIAVGRLRCRVVPDGRGGRLGGIYLETFAVWMIVFFGGQVLIGMLLPDLGLVGAGGLVVASLSALAWPLLRGIPPRQVLEDLGLRWGRWWVPPCAGLWTYALGLPLVVLGLLLAFVISIMLPEAPPPGHPIQDEIASAGFGGVLALLVLAAVVVPPVEEIFFRGVLYRHLREMWGRFGTAISVVLSILISSLLFAALHPQGITFIPVLASLATAFAIARELTGSIWPGIIAHGISNGVIVGLNAALFSA